MVSVTELWEKLEAWYISNNYLSIEQGQRGGQKRNWEHPGNGDRCVTASHQILQRFTELFPKVRRVAIRYTDPDGKDVKRTALAGINFVETSKIAFQGFQRTANEGENPDFIEVSSLEAFPDNSLPGDFQEPSIGFQNPTDRKAMEACWNPTGSLPSGETSKPETPINTGQNNQNAVQRKPRKPISQIPTQQKTGAPPPVNCGQNFKLGLMVLYTGRDPELQKQLPAPARVTSVQPWDKTLWVQRPSGGDVTVPMADVEVVQ